MLAYRIINSQEQERTGEDYSNFLKAAKSMELQINEEQSKLMGISIG